VDLRLVDVACNLCGSARRRLRFEKPGHLTGHRFRIVECEGCGLVYVSPRLAGAQVRALYDEAYFRGRGFDPYVRYEHELHDPARTDADVRRVLARIAAVAPPPADLLEIGPGTGHLLRAARGRGYRALGVELSAHAAGRLREQGLPAVLGSSDDLPVRAGAFDVAVAVEVLEHLTDPARSLGEIARVLRPRGLFYYETGDVECEEARRLGADWDYVRPEGHLYYFSPRTLARYLERTGFRACYPPWFNPTRGAVRLLARLRLLDPARPVLSGARGALARAALAALDRPPSRRPYPMAIRRRA